MNDNALIYIEVQADHSPFRNKDVSDTKVRLTPFCKVPSP
jgi:hypothetical protein